MNAIHLRIITPARIVYEDDILSLTAPSASGEITVLHNHAPLFTLLTDGMITVRKDNDERYYSIGGGYLETTGKTINLLVSRAFGQDEMNESDILKAQQSAKRLVDEAPTIVARHEAMAQLRRSLIDLKVLGKLKKTRSSAKL